MLRGHSTESRGAGSRVLEHVLDSTMRLEVVDRTARACPADDPPRSDRDDVKRGVGVVGESHGDLERVLGAR